MFFDCLASLARYPSYRSFMDSSAAREDHQDQIGLDVEAATGDTSMADVIRVPGEGSSTGM